MGHVEALRKCHLLLIEEVVVKVVVEVVVGVDAAVLLVVLGVLGPE